MAERAQWSFQLTDAAGNALADLTTALGRTIAFKRNSYAEVNFTLSHKDDAAALLLQALDTTGVPKLRGYRRAAGASSSALKFRGPLMALSETSDETSTLTATFRSPFSVLIGDGDESGRFLGANAIVPGNSGSRLPTVAANDTTNHGGSWTGISAATGLPDGVFASVTANGSGGGTSSAYLKLTHSGFAIPATATILGIQVAIDGFVDGFGTGSGDVDVFLVDNGVVQVAATESFTPSVDGFATWDFGGPADLWGTTWLPAQINNPNFGIGIVGSNTSGGATTVQWDVDAAAIAVFYEFDGLTYSSLDSGTIAQLLIDQANAQSFTGLATDPSQITPTVMRDRVYPVAQNIGSAITDLTSVLDGFDFTETFVDGAGQTDAVFGVVPMLGSAKPGVRFEYGAKTLSNCSGLSRTTTAPLNTIFVTGANGLISVYQDAASVAQYGEWWGHDDFSTVTDQATLDAMARALCRPAPVKTLTITPDLALAPLPFDDWDLGDTVSFFAARDALQENTQLRINAFTIPIDDSGFESTSVDDASSPEADAVVNASLIAEVVAT